MRLQKPAIGLPETGAFAAQPFKLAKRQDDGHGFSSSGELDFLTRFDLVHDGGQVRTSLGDGKALQHTDSVHLNVHKDQAAPSARSSVPPEGAERRGASRAQSTDPFASREPRGIGAPLWVRASIP